MENPADEVTRQYLMSLMQERPQEMVDLVLKFWRILRSTIHHVERTRRSLTELERVGEDLSDFVQVLSSIETLWDTMNSMANQENRRRE